MNIWNKNEIMTPVSEYQLTNAYKKHLNQIVRIKQTPINIQTPYLRKKSSVKKLDDNSIKKSLINHIIEINHCPSQYSRIDTTDIPRPSNVGQKIIKMKKLIQDNESIEKRLRQANSVISVQKLNQEYKTNKQYLRNISNNSRRIYNCFLNSQNDQTQSRSIKLE